MKKYNLRSIMLKAWNLHRKTGKTFSECLKIAWCNAKAVAAAKIAAGITEHTHTWFGWKQMGAEVIHESKALFKVSILDPCTKSGTRIVSYFGISQTI